MKLRLNCIPVLVAFLLSSISVALACDCQRLTWEKRVALSEVVFVGRVVEYKPFREVVLEVQEVFKGRVARAARVHLTGSDCDYFLPPVEARRGELYLIYGSRRAARLEVSRCLGSGRVEERGDELQRLRKKRPK